MFNFLKKLLKEEEPEVKKIGLQELKSFFHDNFEVKNKGLHNKLKEIQDELKLEMNKTKENLELLRGAELRNPDIPIRAKQFMDGNRESYIKLVTALLNSLEIREDYASINTFCQGFDDKLAQFTKSTMKAYQILQEFFANESREVALNIKNIDNLVRRLKGTLKNGDLEKAKELENEINSIDNKKEKKAELERELKEKEAEKEDRLQSKIELNQSHGELKESKHYSEFIGLTELKKKYLNELHDLTNKLHHSFSVIGAAIKKYERITIKNIDILNDYFKDPIHALMNDNELKILEFLQGTKANIMNNSIGIKNTKKDKVLEEIGKLDQDYFTDFRSKYNETEKKIANVDDKITQNNSGARLEDIERQMKDTDHTIERLENSIIDLKSEIEKIDFEKIKRKLETEIKEVFGIVVDIT